MSFFTYGFEKRAAERLVGGKADGQPDSKFDKKQIKAGIKVEREHIPDPEARKEIAKDHLTEDPKYYSHLKEMENKYVKTAFIAGFEKKADARVYDFTTERAKRPVTSAADPMVIAQRRAQKAKEREVSIRSDINSRAVDSVRKASGGSSPSRDFSSSSNHSRPHLAAVTTTPTPTQTISANTPFSKEIAAGKSALRKVAPYAIGGGLLAAGGYGLYKTLAHRGEKTAFVGGFEKKASAYAHFIHTAGLTDNEKQSLHESVLKVGDFRKRAVRQAISETKASGFSFGGKNNWSEDAMHTFLEKNPSAKGKVWLGNSPLYGKKAGEEPTSEAVIVTHLPDGDELPKPDRSNWSLHHYVHHAGKKQSDLEKAFKRLGAVHTMNG